MDHEVNAARTTGVKDPIRDDHNQWIRYEDIPKGGNTSGAWYEK